MKLKGFEYNGFKLYLRKRTHPMLNSLFTIYYNIIIQYIDGVPTKAWVQETEKGLDINEFDSWERTPLPLTHNDEFIRNMSEEEVFGILL